MVKGYRGEEKLGGGVMLITWRTLFGTVNTILYSVSLMVVPVSLMTVLNCSMPLLVAVIAYIPGGMVSLARERKESNKGID